jgi:hypothetical protein
MKTILSVVLCLAVNAASASDWAYLGGDDKLSVFLDKESISRAGKYRKAWISYTYPEGRLIDGRNYYSSKSLTYYSCPERTSGTFQIIYYSEQYGKGDPITSRTSPVVASALYEVVPDSYGETILKHVCKATLPSM